MAESDIMKTKVSLICTLKNEAQSIGKFIESTLRQSRIPDEIIMVDGGSNDGTVDIIKSEIERFDSIRLIIKDGVNIAEGRNLAIRNANYDIIASTDLGCTLHEDWLKNLILPFETDSKTDVVAGWYESENITPFDRCISDITYPKLATVLKDPSRFLPSSRSVAFKKSCWEKVGGYPEWLYTAEDTLFDLNLKKNGCHFEFAPEAVVYWRPRSNIGSVLKQCYLYGKGDGMARLFPTSYLSIFIRYVIAFFIVILIFIDIRFVGLLLGLLVVYYIIIINRLSIDYKQSVICKVVMLFLIDLAKIIGYLNGLLLNKNEYCK